MSETIVIYRRERTPTGLVPLFKGFLTVEIKTFRVEYAPSYSGHGPFQAHEYSYVELTGERWALSSYTICNESTGNDYETRRGVTLRRTDPLPEGLYQEPESRFS